MKNKFSVFFVLCIVICSSRSLPSDVSLVTSSEKTNENKDDQSDNVLTEEQPTKLKITEMKVETNVSHRFVKTLITSHVKNFATTAQEAVFSVVLPESAYISGFIMEIDGKSYAAHVKEKEEATQIYNQAVAAGQSAGRVEVSARDSNRFTVSVNVEPESKAVFLLTYEDLLQRKHDKYEIVLNIQPGEVIKDLEVKVNIKESRHLEFVTVPSLRSGNEISKNSDDLLPNANIALEDTSAVVTFKPDAEQQKMFAEKLGTDKESGFAGQFVVEYDVQRDPQAGEILVNDGYFVHFFGADDIPPMPKHVVFVLDVSGSMGGRKIEQLREAMLSILPKLKPEDLFNILIFSSAIEVLDIGNLRKTTVNFEDYRDTRERLFAALSETSMPGAIPANEANIEAAKLLVEQIGPYGSTNIIGALEVGLFLDHKAHMEHTNNSTHQPMIIFLTDGEPNEGMSNTDEIVSKIEELNNGETKIPIFSLSFGGGADKAFLRKLSSKNHGFSRHIYEASDASLQLEKFYEEISSPLLSGVSFDYVPEEITEVTKNKFPLYFRGSEMVVAGRHIIPGSVSRPNNNCIRPEAYARVPGPHHYCPPITPVGWGTGGRVVYKSVPETPAVGSEGSLERIWAYLTIKQKLAEREVAENKTTLTKEALDLALKYSFVTPVTSLVIVKPNSTNSAVNTEDASSHQPTPTYYARGGGGPIGPSRTYAYSPRLSGVPSPAYHGTPMMSPRVNIQRYPSVGWNGGYSELNGRTVSHPTIGWGRPPSHPQHVSLGPRPGIVGSRTTRRPPHRPVNHRPAISVGRPPSHPPHANFEPRPAITVGRPTMRPPHHRPGISPDTYVQHRLNQILQRHPWINGTLSNDNKVAIDEREYDLDLQGNQNLGTYLACFEEDENNATVEGKCKPLYKCQRQTASLEEYKHHICVINSAVAGICCIRNQHRSTSDIDNEN